MHAINKLALKDERENAKMQINAKEAMTTIEIKRLGLQVIMPIMSRLSGKNLIANVLTSLNVSLL